jgi:hypothetical protein
MSTSSPRPVYQAASVNDLSSAVHGNYFDPYENFSHRSSSDWHMPTSEDVPLHPGAARWHHLTDDRARRSSTGTFPVYAAAQFQHAHQRSSALPNAARERFRPASGPQNAEPAAHTDQPPYRSRPRPAPHVSSRSQFYHPSTDGQQ